MDETALTRAALERALSHAGAAYEGRLDATVRSAASRWDPLELRTIHEVAISLWKEYGAFDVIFDLDGAVVGFVDHDKYEGCGQGALDSSTARDLAIATGLVPKDARLESLGWREARPGVFALAAVFFLVRPARSHARVEVEINASRRAVIAVRPLAGGPAGGGDGHG